MHCTPARPGAPFPAPMLTTTRASTLSLLGHMACRTEKPFPSSLEATGVSFFACTVLENIELVFNSPLCLRQTFCVCPECVDQQSSLNQSSAEQSNGCHEAQSYNPLIAPAALAQWLCIATCHKIHGLWPGSRCAIFELWQLAASGPATFTSQVKVASVNCSQCKRFSCGTSICRCLHDHLRLRPCKLNPSVPRYAMLDFGYFWVCRSLCE